MQVRPLAFILMEVKANLPSEVGTYKNTVMLQMQLMMTYFGQA